MSIGIYKITNLINGYVYIGQSIHMQYRFRQHINMVGKDNNYFHNAIKKYGENNFIFEVVEECDLNLLNERERYWISKYNSLYPNGYNMTDGGQDHHTNYIYLSQENVDDIIYLLTNELQTSINQIAAKYNVSFQTISDINTGKTHIKDDLCYPLRKNKAYQQNNHKKCIICGVDISSKATRCKKCSIENSQRVDRPDKLMLAKEICDIGFEAVGRKYGVSGNAIKKWCGSYGIPRLKKELKEWLNNQ